MKFEKIKLEKLNFYFKDSLHCGFFIVMGCWVFNTFIRYFYPWVEELAGNKLIFAYLAGVFLVTVINYYTKDYYEKSTVRP